MKINWSAIAQAVVIAALLGLGGGLWQTYQQAARIPGLEADLRKLSGELDRLGDKIEAARTRQDDMRTVLAVLEERSRVTGRDTGRQFLPADQ